MITKEQIEEHRKQREKVYFHTTQKFINDHNGFRPGNIHLVLGTSGGGKSTLTRSILSSICAYNSINVGVLLSEETVLDYASMLPEQSQINGLGKIKYVSEIEQQNFSELHLSEWLANEKIEILFYDNITTSRLYMGKSPKEQEEFSYKLKELAAFLNIPIIVIAHTDGTIRSSHKMITQNDIRGNKTIVNLSPFLYIIQKFEINKKIFQFVYTEKYRNFKIADRIHFLVFDEQTSLFQRSEAVDFEAFKDLFKQRNQL